MSLTAQTQKENFEKFQRNYQEASIGVALFCNSLLLNFGNECFQSIFMLF